MKPDFKPIYIYNHSTNEHEYICLRESLIDWINDSCWGNACPNHSAFDSIEQLKEETDNG